MKFKVEREYLLEIILSASKAISNKSTLPILGGILLSVDKNTLTSYATDLEVAIKRVAKIKSDSKEEIVVPARLLSDIIKNMPDGSIDVSLNKTDNRLELTSGSAHFGINTLPAEDYPVFPEIKSDETLLVSAGDFNSSIHGVIGSSSKDENRPILTGILLSIKGHKASLIATDSYRLATTELKLLGDVPGDKEIIIPARTLDALSSMTGKEKEIKISLSENQATFSFNNTTIATKLIGGQFPDYKQLFPEKHEIEVDVEKDHLEEALKRVSLMAHNNSPLKLNIGSENIKITTQTADVGEAKEVVKSTKKGPDIEIAFNSRYLIEGIETAEDKNIKILLSDPLQPGLIKNKEKENYNYLVMPIRLT